MHVSIQVHWSSNRLEPLVIEHARQDKPAKGSTTLAKGFAPQHVKCEVTVYRKGAATNSFLARENTLAPQMDEFLPSNPQIDQSLQLSVWGSGLVNLTQGPKMLRILWS